MNKKARNNDNETKQTIPTPHVATLTARSLKELEGLWKSAIREERCFKLRE
jgi:hypothetical protein